MQLLSSRKLKKPSDEFCNLLQVEKFVEAFSKFLHEKQCPETLEFILLVQHIEKDPNLLDLILPSLVEKYIKLGSVHELNLSHEDRTLLLNRFSHWYHSKTEKCTQDLKITLVHVKTLQLLQLQQERYQEFRRSPYWNTFMCKLQEESQQKQVQVDWSFRWLTPMKQWTPKQVSLWLQSMEIEEYALFEEHEIDGEILLSITRSDLVTIGITKIGSLRKVLRLIQDISKHSLVQ